MKKAVRLDKFLADAGAGTRSEVKKYIQKGKVQVNGVPAKKSEIKVSEEDEVVLDGNRISQAPEFVYYLLNKPAGCVSATEDRNDRTVMEYVPSDRKGLFPVGRLDKDSEGLLLLTNQGDLVNRIMRAGNYHEKEYLVTVNKEITEDFLKGMRGGVPILDTVTRPCTVKKTGRRSFQIILTQGLNRQIRRMCEYLGYHVRTLKRVRIMNLTLDGLKCGAYREIRRDEWSELKELIRNSSSETITETGGHHGNSRGNPNERTGSEAERGGKGILSGRQRNHEQQGVRRAVRRTGADRKNNRNRSR